MSGLTEKQAIRKTCHDVSGGYLDTHPENLGPRSICKGSKCKDWRWVNPRKTRGNCNFIINPPKKWF